MNSNISKYNNLNFRLKDGTHGFIKVDSRGSVYLYCNRGFCKKEWDVDAMMPKNNFITSFSDEGLFNLFVEEEGLEIIPRDSETYEDWKVGDMVCSRERMLVCIVVAQIGEITFLEPLEGSVTPYFHTGRGMKECYRLVPTDYEKELLRTKEEDEKKCTFRKGDRVLVRNRDDDRWLARIFDCYHKELKYKYECKDDKGNTDDDMYIQCLPFNEHTWQLLGTTDEYKAIDNNESH